jgi:hypothetical protein
MEVGRWQQRSRASWHKFVITLAVQPLGRTSPRHGRGKQTEEATQIRGNNGVHTKKRAYAPPEHKSDEDDMMDREGKEAINSMAKKKANADGAEYGRR